MLVLLLLTRRLATIAFATRLLPTQPSIASVSYVSTSSGLLYFDSAIVFGATGFDDQPCRGDCLERAWALNPELVSPASSTAVSNPVGTQVQIEYRVRRRYFNGEIAALSDGIGNGGAILFTVGDGTTNAAVDELVRTLPPNVVRRAIVPATFDLDRGTRAEYPRPEPAGTTYLEMTLRKLSATGPMGVCPGGDERYNKVVSSVCGS